MEVDLDGHPGLVLRPPNARFLYVLAHGAGAGMHHAFMTAIAEALAAEGVATLRWEVPFMAAGKARLPRRGPSGRSVALRPVPAPVAGRPSAGFSGVRSRKTRA